MADATTLTPVEELSPAALDTTSVNFDFSEGYPERWDFIAALYDETLGKYIVPEGDLSEEDQAVLEEAGESTDCHDRYYELERDMSGPQMNYYYPLPDYRYGHGGSGYDWSDALLIADLPLCIVSFDDNEEWGDNRPNYALALTGGGMDLSWEICEAFMRLGFLPPIAFADLPQMAGYPRGEEQHWVLKGCIEAVHQQRERQVGSLARILSRLKGIEEHGA